MSNVSIPLDSCNNPLFFTPEELGCVPGEFCCTARFEANPDASGIGIVVAFAINGGINMAIATFLWYLKNFRRPFHHRFEKYIQNLADFLAQASLFPGITLLVAGLSQLKTITHFHLWVSVVLADLCTSGRVVVLLNVFYGAHRVTKIQAALAALFQGLFLASLGILIYRLSNWANEPGQCFAFRNNGRQSYEERNFIRLWVIIQLAVWGYWHLICPWQVYLARKQLEKVPKIVRFWFSFVFYVVFDLFLWIWQLYLIAQGMVGNKDRIIGSEWEMGFGQVASLAALVAVVYAIVLSWQDYLLKLKLSLNTPDMQKDMEMAFVAL
ncbi:hypothetical protein M408DRAFT_329551 [Serendipita vermifera MAFF 305830]|uniref:Uncharacterized protein n=1 Tax=Serendipita vermifera MAFF 305830 TaxID=933852 RepID=A0A0C2WPP1_SERVB|nr:hypothetical protein M408DRAFT_329551 [Serendipita vermifera MAFF 305830]